MTAAPEVRDTLRKFADRIAEVRKIRGLTFEQAAALVDGAISTEAIARFERSARAPRFESLIQLCRIYDMDVLFKRDGTVEVRGTGLRSIEDQGF